MRDEAWCDLFVAGGWRSAVFADRPSPIPPRCAGGIGRSSRAAGLAIAVAIAAATAGQQARADTPADGRPPAAVNAGLTYELGIGDRLRIRIYEREDLSGETRVRPDGMVVVPLIGAFQAAGRHAATLEQEVAQALVKRNARPASVAVEVIEWRPIFAIGIVDKPGTYPFVPGMTVLHALAAAGGVHRPMAAAGLILDAAREAGQLQRSRAQLGNALAREARLQAELQGQPEVAPPSRLVEVVGPAAAGRIMAAESRFLRERLAHHQQQLTSLDEEIALTVKEIAAIKAQHAAATSQAEASGSELAEIDAVARRGFADKLRLLGVRREAAYAEGQAHAILVSLARSERALASSRQNRSMLVLNRRLRIEEELKSTQEDVRSHELGLSVSSRVLQQIGSEALPGSEPRKTYRIMRLVGGSPVMIEAEETTALQPGDLVRVGLAAAHSDDIPGPRAAGPSGTR